MSVSIVVEVVTGRGPTMYSCQYMSVVFVAPTDTVALAYLTGSEP